MSQITLHDARDAAMNTISKLTRVSVTSKTLAGPYVDYWIGRFLEEDSRYIHVFVEAPFFIPIAPKTFIVGVVDDSVMRYPTPADPSPIIVGCEWKTCRAPKKNKGGGDSAYWNEEIWLNELREGPQVGTYALAMNRGTFLTEMSDGTPELIDMRVAEPHMRIRALVKDIPARVWPTNPENGLFKFPMDVLNYIERAYLVKAEMIRAMRKSGYTPWQLPGDQCHKFNSICQHYPICTAHRHPPIDTPTVGIQPTDPANRIIPYLGEDPRDPEVLIISFSAYSNATRCAEKFRLDTMDGAAGEDSEALDIGTCFHAGVAAVNKMIQRNNFAAQVSE